jgi:ribosomal protein L11 methyltransferase
MICARIASDDHDITSAFLSRLDFVAGLQEEPDHILAYLPESRLDDLKEYLSREVNAAVTAWEYVPLINWNAEWESNFEPVEIGSFCRIRAPFHESRTSEFQHEIIIAPEMAFGTGHHETTRMMIKAMSQIDLNGLSVLDFGAGTGILSILSEKMGAERVDAIDHQQEAVDNIGVNMKLNGCTRIDPGLGSLERCQEQAYDIILANINLRVILNHISQLSRMLQKGGKILLSGILITYESAVAAALEDSGLKCTAVQREGEWLMMTAST